MEKIRLLMLDDDQDDYLIVRSLLTSLPHRNYTIDWAATIEEALAALTKESYDAFLVDYWLGLQEGTEFIRKAIEAGCHQPFILLTAMDDPRVDEEAQTVGASDYVMKTGMRGHEMDRSIRYARKHAENLQKINLLNSELEIKVAERTKDLYETVQQLQHQIEINEETTHKLAFSERLFTQILEGYRVGSVTVIDRLLNIVVTGGASWSLFGLNKDDAIGKRGFPMVQGEEWEEIRKTLRAVFDGEAFHDHELRQPFLDQYYFVFDAFPLYSLEGAIDYVAIFTRNVTELRKAQEDLHNALGKEKKLSELKSRFVSMASHEFRTPLTIINSSASLIGAYMEKQEVENVKKHVSRIKMVVNNLEGILADFLSLGKLEEGRVAVNLKNFNLPELVGETLGEIKHLLKTGQSFEHSHSGEEMVHLDEYLLKNMLINLLSNAIKYSPENKCIKIETEVADGKTDIRVCDQGIGISEEDHKNLFNPFFRGSNVGATPGTGLGLNITRRHVELMGGQIGCESTLGEGSCFWLKF